MIFLTYILFVFIYLVSLDDLKHFFISHYKMNIMAIRLLVFQSVLIGHIVGKWSLVASFLNTEV